MDRHIKNEPSVDILVGKTPAEVNDLVFDGMFKNNRSPEAIEAMRRRLDEVEGPTTACAADYGVRALLRQRLSGQSPEELYELSRKGLSGEYSADTLNALKYQLDMLYHNDLFMLHKFDGVDLTSSTQYAQRLNTAISKAQETLGLQ